MRGSGSKQWEVHVCHVKLGSGNERKAGLSSRLQCFRPLLYTCLNIFFFFLKQNILLLVSFRGFDEFFISDHLRMAITFLSKKKNGKNFSTDYKKVNFSMRRPLILFHPLNYENPKIPLA